MRRWRLVVERVLQYISKLILCFGKPIRPFGSKVSLSLAELAFVDSLVSLVSGNINGPRASKPMPTRASPLRKVHCKFR